VDGCPIHTHIYCMHRRCCCAVCCYKRMRCGKNIRYTIPLSSIRSASAKSSDVLVLNSQTRSKERMRPPGSCIVPAAATASFRLFATLLFTVSSLNDSFPVAAAMEETEMSEAVEFINHKLQLQMVWAVKGQHVEHADVGSADTNG
jgi:hypothetical protein